MKLVYGILLLVVYVASEKCTLRNIRVITGDKLCDTTRQDVGEGAYVVDCDLYFMCSQMGVAACPSDYATEACVPVPDDCNILEKPAGSNGYLCMNSLE